MNEWLKLIPYATGILMVILLGEYFLRIRKTGSAFSRKVVHFGVGILTFMTPFYFNEVMPLITIAFTFVIINALTLYLKLFKGMEVPRKTYGTILFPFSFLLLLWFCWDEYRFLVAYGISLMTFADGFASVVGEGVKRPVEYFPAKDRKSVQGSVTLFVISGLLTFIFIQFRLFDLPAQSIDTIWKLFYIVLIMGVVTVLLENISIHGSDNITLPLLGSLFFLRLLENGLDMLLLSGGVFTVLLIVAMGSYYKKWLTIGGGMAMILLGMTVAIFGNWKLLIPLFLFFVLSSILSKFRDKRDARPNHVEAKNSNRDVVQVLANGILPAAIALFSYLFNDPFSYLAFGAAIAAVTADTWSTEVGFFSKSDPVSIISWRKVPKGTSGGISVAGTFGGLLGAMIISAIMFLVFPENIGMNNFILISLAGFSGSVIDSLLGATVQVKYKCHTCGKITEKRFHCNMESVYNRGVKFISNDMVNILCALSAVLLIYLVSVF